MLVEFQDRCFTRITDSLSVSMADEGALSNRSLQTVEPQQQFIASNKDLLIHKTLPKSSSVGGGSPEDNIDGEICADLDECTPDEFNRSVSCPSAERDTCHNIDKPERVPSRRSSLPRTVQGQGTQDSSHLDKALACPTSLLRSKFKVPLTFTDYTIEAGTASADTRIQESGSASSGLSAAVERPLAAANAFHDHSIRPLSPLCPRRSESRQEALCRSATSSPDSRGRERLGSQRGSLLCPEGQGILTTKSKTMVDRSRYSQETYSLSTLDRRAHEHRRSMDLSSRTLSGHPCQVSRGEEGPLLRLDRQSSVHLCRTSAFHAEGHASSVVERSAPFVIERRRRRSGSFSSGELSLEESWARANCILVPSTSRSQSPAPGSLHSPASGSNCSVPDTLSACASPLREAPAVTRATLSPQAPNVHPFRQDSPSPLLSDGDTRTESPFDRRQRRACAAQRDKMSLAETMEVLNMFASGSRGSSPARCTSGVLGRNASQGRGVSSPLRPVTARSVSNCSPLRSALRQGSGARGAPKARMFKCASGSEASGDSLGGASPDSGLGTPSPKQVQFNAAVEIWEGREGPRVVRDAEERRSKG